MKNLLKKIRKSNKGFTLVELIIVVAIIAVLTAVAAPQYIKYVERSRYATDLNCLAEIAHAAEIAKVGNGSTTPSANTVTVDVGGALAYASSNDLTTAVAQVVPASSYTFVSKTFTEHADITITIQTAGNASYTAPTAP